MSVKFVILAILMVLPNITGPLLVEIPIFTGENEYFTIRFSQIYGHIVKEPSSGMVSAFINNCHIFQNYEKL